MGREIKRVAAGFDWPMGETWPGFLNPHYDGHCKNCGACDKTGYSPQAKYLHDQWYGYISFEPRSTGSELLTIEHPYVRAFAERNCNRTPEFYGNTETDVRREAGRLAAFWNGHWSHHLDEADVAALRGAGRLRDLPVDATARQVNEWSLGGFGHDSISNWICIKAKCARLGYPHQCPICLGEGSIWDSPENKALHENWQPEEPPAGDWWQVWETVSEGTAVTPAFATAEALVDYLVEGGDAWDRKRGAGGWDRENAVSFAGRGHAFSLMMVDGKTFEPRDGAPPPKVEASI